ncbi:hypothetical protein BDZ91DRAFT_732453 [Kalaharituber pfeilii]|nr:hypothetical protein BDZ91DRAFT_732453 [Kalaharituber pfeilii]
MQAAKEAVKDFINPTRTTDENVTAERSHQNGERNYQTRDLNAAGNQGDERGYPAGNRGTRADTVDETVIIQPVIHSERKADTEVREVVNPAITKEVVIEENREKKVTAVDRELHQDHYQTRVQPVLDKKILPEEHVHRSLPVEYKERKHHKQEEIRRALEEERSRFQSTREVLPTRHTVESGETVIGEHHHHHVYEMVQPVIEREVIHKVVTHTTVPIHERIEKDPSFHPKTIQPVMTMEEFLRAGGTIEGRAERMDIFEGEPQVMENGGADRTHPSWDSKGHHIDIRPDAPVIRSGMTTTTTTTRRVEGPVRTGSPLTASERERIMQGPTTRSKSPLGSPGLHTAGRAGATLNNRT